MAIIGNKHEPISWRLSVLTFMIQSSHSTTNIETTDERVYIDETGVLMIDVTDMTPFLKALVTVVK